MKKAFNHFIRHYLYPFLNDVFFPFVGFSALGIFGVFSITLVVRLIWVTAVFTWNLL